MSKYISAFILILSLIFINDTYAQVKWKPNTDWGHWILGHKADFSFLQKNKMTVTFGSGAPNFDEVSRSEFDKQMEEAKKINKLYHDSGYTVLRYLSTSLNGTSKSNKDKPSKDQIHYLKFYNEQWENFIDYIGAKPPEDPTTWIMVYPDGTFPYYRYAPYGQETDEGFEAWGVPVNPHYVRLMEGKIRAQAETGIDGSYIDWTHIAEGTSYDKYSHSGFIEYLNKFLPKNVSEKKYDMSDYSKIELPQNKEDKFWMEWITYRGYQVAEFHKHMRTTARKYNPDFMISGNVFGGFGFGPIAYLGAGNMELLAREGYDDFIYSEMQEYLDAAPHNNNGMKITNSPALKFLAAAAHGKPVIVYATEITPPIFPDATEKALSAMAQINIAEAVSNHCIFREKRETPPGATDIYNFLHLNRNYFTGADLYSNIAILASLNQYLADEQSFAFSTSRVLSDRGINHTFIVEDDLASSMLNNYELIILPYIPLLSSEKQDALIEFVKNGGQLIILGNTGIKNQYNIVNDKIPFLNVLELKAFPDIRLLKKVGKGNILYIPLTIPDHKFLTAVQGNKDATTFGSSMVNVFADVPEAYTRGKIHPDLLSKLTNIADETEKLLADHLTRLSSGLPFLEASAMMNEDKKTILLHLTNYNVTIDGKVTPVENINTQILIPSGKTVKRVLYSSDLQSMYKIDFEKSDYPKGDLIRITLPEVNIYGLARIELD